MSPQDMARPARAKPERPARTPANAVRAKEPPVAGGLGLVLSGGGAPAAYFGAGVVAALTEAGLKPRIVSGVSAGAINAAALAIGMGAADLGDMWRRIRWSDIYRPRFDLWNLINVRALLRPTTNIPEYLMNALGWTWLLNTAPAERTLNRFLGGEHLKIAGDTTLVISSVDQNTGEVVRFCSALPPEHRRSDEFHKTPLTTEHVLASASVPMLFPPGHHRDHTLVDAGLVANTPLAPAMRYEPDRVIVVSGSGISRPAPNPASFGQAMALLVDNVAQFALNADLSHTETVNEVALLAPMATDKRHVPILKIEPTDLGFSVNGFLRFDADDADKIMQYGRETAAKALANWSV
jgi:NTE family protein